MSKVMIEQGGRKGEIIRHTYTSPEEITDAVIAEQRIKAQLNSPDMLEKYGPMEVTVVPMSMWDDAACEVEDTHGKLLGNIDAGKQGAIMREYWNSNTGKKRLDV